MIFLALFFVYALALSLALGRAGVRSRATGTAGKRRKRPSGILVVGATGGTGKQLVAQALERGYEVTAFVRNPSRLDLEHARLSVAHGDVLDRDSLDAAVGGHDAVVSALGHKRFFYPNRILSRGTINLLQAMRQHDVKRFICQTSLGIGDSAGRMGVYYTFFVIPVILPFYFWDKTRQERAIAKSDRDWVIVRPGRLTNRGQRDRIRHGSRVGNFVTTVRISRSDTAKFMLDQLESNRYLKMAPGVSW